MALADRLALVVTCALGLAFPVAWFAPLLTVQLKFAFWAPGTEISLVSTLQSLWAEDPVLALALSFLTLVAPTLKVLGSGLILTGLLSPRTETALWAVGRLAMADVFLIVVYMALFKGIDGGTLEIRWGLWLFTLSVLASLGLSLFIAARHRP